MIPRIIFRELYKCGYLNLTLPSDFRNYMVLYVTPSLSPPINHQKNCLFFFGSLATDENITMQFQESASMKLKVSYI